MGEKNNNYKEKYNNMRQNSHKNLIKSSISKRNKKLKSMNSKTKIIK